MIHNRKQTINILKFAKEFKFTVEAALILKGIPIKAVKKGKEIAFYYK